MVDPVACFMPDVRLLLGDGTGQAEKPPRPFLKTVELDLKALVGGDRHDFVEESQKAAVPFRDVAALEREMRRVLRDGDLRRLRK